MKAGVADFDTSIKNATLMCAVLNSGIILKTIFVRLPDF